MSDLFDQSNFDKYKEDNCREVKKAEGGLPIALWESYSSFANSNGGVIILGVGERQDGTWYTTGLKNADKLKRYFWNTIHDTKKVSINLLSDKNVESHCSKAVIKGMLRGGISDPRNKTLMKMFNMIGIGERAGSGIPDIYQVWENEGTNTNRKYRLATED